MTVATVTVPVLYGGTGTVYRSDDGAYGMAAQNGYGFTTYFMPMLAEVMEAIDYMLTTSDSSADAAAVSAAAAATTLTATQSLFNRIYLGGF